MLKVFRELLYLLVAVLCFTACQSGGDGNKANFLFDENAKFSAYTDSVLFSGTGEATWDKVIRERGFILFEDGLYKMWYTGYNPDSSDQKFLGYATSIDGIHWERYVGNPIYRDGWTEDVFVLKDKGVYYLFAEGDGDRAHLLTSTDGLTWKSKGDLSITTTEGDTIPAPYGTPTVFIKDDVWYLFYERIDSAVWVATSEDLINWRNIQDEPVLIPGPEEYDKGAIAANQIVEHNGAYYMFYHATSNPDWNKGGKPVYWNSNIAISKDLIEWTKYASNPLVENNESSPIWVDDGKAPKLYTMHKNVQLYVLK